MSTKVIPFTVEMNQVNENGNIIANCNSITFRNIGTSNCWINDYLLIPSDYLSINGNLYEIDVTTYNIKFSANTGVLAIIRKTYKA